LTAVSDADDGAQLAYEVQGRAKHEVAFVTVGGDVRCAAFKPGGRLAWIAPGPPNVALLDAGAVRPPTIIPYKLGKEPRRRITSVEWAVGNCCC
jgi:hypothetical protein